MDTGAQTTAPRWSTSPSGTPAAAAGLEKGDVVTTVDGKPVTDGISLIVAIRSHQPGETVTLDGQALGRRQVDVRSRSTPRSADPRTAR